MSGVRFATFTAAGAQFYGVVTEGGMIALSPEFPAWPSLREVIAGGGFRSSRRRPRGGRSATRPAAFAGTSRCQFIRGHHSGRSIGSPPQMILIAFFSTASV